MAVPPLPPHKSDSQPIMWLASQQCAAIGRPAAWRRARADKMAVALQRLYPTNFALSKLNHLLQDTNTVEAIKAGKSLKEIKQNWTAELEAFKKCRAQYLLYP